MHICCLYIRNESFVISKNITDFGVAVNNAFPLGILYISSSLKKVGHNTEILFYYDGQSEEEITKKIQTTDKVMCISIVSEGDYALGKQLIARIKKQNPKTKIIVGGPYPTLSPQDLIEDNNIDAVCVGEGEVAIPEYVRQVEANDFKKTDNLWIKQENGQIIKCDKSVLIEDIDSIPYPDREGWLKLFKDTSGISHQVLLERGCKYKCIYCSHHALSGLQKGTYLRYRKVEKVIEEIEYICKQYPNITDIKFNVDNVLSSTEYFKNLCEAIIKFNNKREDKKTFAITCNVTPNLLVEDKFVVDLMQKANIKMVSLALDSGSLEIRKKLHRPYYQNDQFINFCRSLRSKQISFGINLLYYPYFNTKEIYRETIDCLIKCVPTVLQMSWLIPLKGTQLYKTIDAINYKDAKLIDKWYFHTLKYRVFYGIYGLKMFHYLSPFNLVTNYFINKLNLIKEKIKSKQELNLRTAKREFDNKNYKKAIKYFNKVKITEHNYWILGDRAIAKMSIGDYDGAIKDFDKVLQLYPQEIYKKKKEEAEKLKGM